MTVSGVSLLQRTLEHLKALVAIDTQNQSGDADSNQLFDYVQQCLPGFNCHQSGTNGAQYLYAQRGHTDLLFNIHIDTVPANANWSSQPLELEINNDRAIGLGACDIKGALACWLAALETQPDAAAALLLCSDEEAGGSRGIRQFLSTKPDYKLALIAEPTQCKGITEHRGYLSATVKFAADSGHSSEPRALQDNAIHRCGHYLVKLQDLAKQHLDNPHSSDQKLKGICLNAGKISGGIKNNMIADYAELSFGSRPLPGQASEQLLQQYQALANECNVSDWQTLSNDPALPAGPNAPDAKKFLSELNIPAGDAVSFWTEAALFSAAGIPAIVFGPGDIAQAHSADEWVALEQLETMTGYYVSLLSKGKLE